MSLVIMDNSLVTYALQFALQEKQDYERSNWICNRIKDNIDHLDKATLLHLQQLINDEMQDQWDYMQRAPFKSLRSYIVGRLEIYS